MRWNFARTLSSIVLLAYPALLFAFDPNEFLNQAMSPDALKGMGVDVAGTSWGDRLLANLISLVCGALVGTFFSDRLRPFRRTLLLISVALTFIGIFVFSPLFSNVVVFSVGAAVAFFLLRNVLKNADDEKNKSEEDKTFGSARWATLADCEKLGVLGSTGLQLGNFAHENDAKSLHYTGNRHLLTVAPTRSGKGVSSIIPNLLTYDGSVLVIDPKGENARITAKRRGSGDKALGIEGMGQAVHVVDPWGITGLPVARLNPLDWLQPDDPDISENAMMLADAFVQSRGGNDAFWDEEAKALLMGIILYVALHEDEQDQRHLGRVRDIITAGGDELEDILKKMYATPNPIVRSTARRTADKDEKLRLSVMASLQSHTHFLDSPRIRASLDVSDFDFGDLKADKQSIYLVLPADRLETFGRWLRLLVQQAITINARNIEIKPEKPIVFLLDEMPALGRLSMVEQAYGLMAGFGMQLWGIVQDLSQLERIYEKSWETFVGNSGVIQYFGSRDLKTAEYCSKLCGICTTPKFSLSVSIANAISWARSVTENLQGASLTTGTTHSRTDTYGLNRDVIQRNLANADELMVMRNQDQLIFVETCYPIRGQKTPWFEDDTLSKQGVSLIEATPALEHAQPSLFVVPETPETVKEEEPA